MIMGCIFIFTDYVVLHQTLCMASGVPEFLSPKVPTVNPIPPILPPALTSTPRIEVAQVSRDVFQSLVAVWLAHPAKLELG